MPSLFDAIRARIRAQATGGAAPQAPASPTSPTGGETPSLAGSLTSAQYGTGATASTAMGAGTPAVDAQAPQAETGFLTSNPAYAAAKEAATPVGVFDTSTKMGKAGQTVLSAFDPVPFAPFASLVSGTMAQTPMGTTSFRPSGVLGAVFDVNMNNQYDVAAQIAAGTPGYHQFMSDGKVVSLTPGPMGLGTVVNGTFNGTSQQAMNQYAAMFGVDPKTADFSARPGEDAFGEALTGFVGFSGGFDSNGNFVDAAGNTNTASLSVEAMTNHVGLVNDFVGLEAAMNAVDFSNMDQSVKDTMMNALAAGELHANAATDKEGNIVGFQTATGGVVQGMFDSKGNPVTTGTGIVSPDAMNSWASNNWAAANFGIDAVSSPFGGFSAGFGPGDMSAGTIGEWAAFDTAPFESIGVSGIGDAGNGADAGSFSSSSVGGVGEGAGDSGDFGGFAARGGKITMAEGGTPPVLQEGETPAGFANKQSTPPPVMVGDGEPATEAETVADNIPADVPEGTFVLNAPAIEFAGSEDIKKMLLGAMEEAERQGIDITQNNTKMSKEKLVSLVVSKKEALIPPLLAEIIGYDRLEKINNRGKKEVERRIAENGQDIPQEAVNAAAGGGEQGFAKPTRTNDQLYNDPRTEEELASFNQVIEQNKDKNFVQRMLDANSKGMPVEGEPGAEKTHRMNAEYFPDTNEWVAFPSVIQKSSGEMYDFGKDVIAAGDHARNTGEYISFGNDADAAIRFSIHYKDSSAWGKGRGSKKKMAYGGDSGIDEVPKIYESIKRQGGDPRLDFEDFSKTMKAFQKGKVYRPMREEPDTPEFDAEVRQKYNLFFPDDEQKYPYMDEAEREAAREMDKANMIDMSLPLAREREDGTIYYVDRRTGKEVPAPQGMAPGGFVESLAAAKEKYAEREPRIMLNHLQMSDNRQEVAGEVRGDGFAVRGRANRAQDARSTEYPDGVVVDEENKNLGFALNGELYLFDDNRINAGIEKQKDSFKGTANIPTGERVRFGNDTEMTRYNMGATFGDLNFDVSGMPGEGIDRGRVKYKLNKNGDELSIEGDKSGNISAGLRLSF